MYLSVYCEFDRLYLTHGKHDLFIPTDSRHNYIFVHVEDGDHQVCGSDVSTANACAEDGGFRLVVEVKGDSAAVTWVAPVAGGRFDDILGDD